MHSLISRESRALRFALASLLMFCAFAFTTSSAQAAPGALKIVVIDSLCAGWTYESFITSMQAEPGVASITQLNSSHIDDPGGTGLVPTAADFAGADAVVLKNECRWADPVGLGNVVADFQDAGGVVIADTWSFWDEVDDPGYQVRGRWQSAGYAPFNQTVKGLDTQQGLGAHDPTHPFFVGVGPLTNIFTYPTTVVAPGAAGIGTWADGSPALAVKGRAVGLNAFIADDPGINGNYGRLVVNAIKSLVPRAVSITRAGSGNGIVKPVGGALDCAAACTGTFPAGTALNLGGIAAKGSVFTGWSGACTGRATCAYTVGYPGAFAALWNNPELTASFALVKLKYGKFKKGKLSVTLPGPGKLTVKASGVKTISKTVKKAGTIKLTVKATGKLKKKLAAGKTVKVKFKFGFRPTGAAKPARSTKMIKIKK